MKVESSRRGRDLDDIRFSLIGQVNFEKVADIVGGAGTFHDRWFYLWMWVIDLYLSQGDGCAVLCGK